MCSALLNIYVKGHENISHSFQLTEWTLVHGRNGYIQCSKGNNSESRKPRAMGNVLCTSSHGALHLCEVS